MFYLAFVGDLGARLFVCFFPSCLFCFCLRSFHSRNYRSQGFGFVSAINHPCVFPGSRNRVVCGLPLTSGTLPIHLYYLEEDVLSCRLVVELPPVNTYLPTFLPPQLLPLDLVSQTPHNNNSNNNNPIPLMSGPRQQVDPRPAKIDRPRATWDDVVRK